MLGVTKNIRFFFYLFCILIIFVATKSFGQLLPYAPINLYQNSPFPLLQRFGTSAFNILLPKSLLYPSLYSEILTLNQLTKIFELYTAINLNNDIISSTDLPDITNVISASVDTTPLYPFLPLLSNFQFPYGTALTSNDPISNSLSNNQLFQTLGFIQNNQTPFIIGQSLLGLSSSIDGNPYSLFKRYGLPFSDPVYYPAGGLFSVTGPIPPYRINDTGITLAEKYGGVWQSTVYLGATGEIKLREITQYETEFFADIKFKSHPVASTEGSVIGIVEGNTLTFTVHFDNACTGTFVGSGTSAFINGTYVINCFNGSYVDEGTFELEAE